MITADDEGRLELARAEGRARLRAGIYTRMSIAAIGDTTKVDDQELISRELAERRGLAVADDAVYCDNNKSAWRKDRKRPGWDRMLADVEARRIDAIVVYHGDRLIRQPWDLERLLALAESKGIRLLSPSGTRNLDSADDRFILRIEAAQACRESDNTSRRRKAQYERWRREGRVRPGGRGGRAFGYSTDGVSLYPPDRCDVATRAGLTEAGVIREMAACIEAGEGNAAIGRDVSARGWRTPAGGEFTHGTITKMMRRPRYAGLMPDGESRAAWPAILERDVWERVCLRLDGKAAGFGHATNARRWLLSGIATCGAPHGDGECGAPMRLNPSKGKNGRHVNGYQCTRKGCSTYRSAEHLDAYVSVWVVARLKVEGNPAGELPADPGHAAEWARLQSERAESEALAAEYESSAGRLKLILRRLDSIDARMGELRGLADTSARDRLREQYRGITLEQYRGLPLDVRRALVSATVTVTVLPASKRGPGFRTEDVRVVAAG